MSDLYVIGGQQRAARPLLAGNKDWNGYEKGLILRVSPETGSATPCVQYVSPPEVCAPDDPAITFQASTMQGDLLYTCTQTEVLIYTMPGFEKVGYISLPCFNDLHHVHPTPDGNIIVANAGLEMIMELSATGEVLREWNVLGEDPWANFAKSADYRKISTKPHRSHPNYVFYVDNELWVTRFHQGDAICLDHPAKRIHISSERIHDGVVHDGFIYHTSVNGHLIISNPKTLRVEEKIDLNSMHSEDVLLGWCRSVLVNDGKAWIGFSRIRPTKLRQNVTWVLRGFKQVQPTHIACYDLVQHRCLQEIDLEAPTGMAAIYSIFSVPG